MNDLIIDVLFVASAFGISCKILLNFFIKWNQLCSTEESLTSRIALG